MTFLVGFGRRFPTVLLLLKMGITNLPLTLAETVLFVEVPEFHCVCWKANPEPECLLCHFNHSVQFFLSFPADKMQP